jgi:small subunit ribosomal protein S7
MLQSIPRRLLRNVRYSVQWTAMQRPALPLTKRHFGISRPSSKDDSQQHVSDFVASQKPPSNPETPPDRMPHQTEEDVTSEKIFDNQPQREDGIPPEAVPVEEVIKETPGGMEKAPQAIKEENSATSGEESLHGDGGWSDQNVRGRSAMPHVTEENIAYARIISGDEVTGAANSTPGEETPASAVPIEEVVGEREKPAVMHPSAGDEEPPSGGQTLANQIDDEVVDQSTTSTRKSILDLFGTEQVPKKRSKVSTKGKAAAPPPQSINPLSSQGLDLSAWESPRSEEVKHKVDPDPEPWATQRGTWEEPHETSESEATTKELEIRKLYESLQPLPPKRPPIPFDARLPKTESSPSSPWDFFYPPPPPPKSLSSVEREEYESLHPEARRKVKEKAYDPFARQEKPLRWPFLHNRDEFVNLCINHVMRHGKKATAEKIMQDVFFQLMEFFPRQHPVTILAEAVDRNAPLMKTAKTAGVRGVLRPVALNERQRIRQGWLSMVTAAGRAVKENFRVPFQIRLATEIARTMEGKGPGMPKRQQTHLMAMANKLNIKVPRKVKAS